MLLAKRQILVKFSSLLDLEEGIRSQVSYGMFDHATSNLSEVEQNTLEQ